MPDPEDPTVKAAERRRRQQITATSGRTSTILSGSQGGTQAYISSLLGSA